MAGGKILSYRYNIGYLIAAILVLVFQVIMLSSLQADHSRELQVLQLQASLQPPVAKAEPCPVSEKRTNEIRGTLQDTFNEPKLRYDSSDATVMAMAQGYDLDTHRRFVGSLRKSGFQGSIMLATEPELQNGVEEYLLSKNVTILRLNYTECIHKILEDHEVKNKKDEECNTCIAPYQNVKIRWGRFPFLRDALQKCEKCTGPVLFSDVRDTLFQRDPFADGAPEIEGLHLYTEWRENHAGHYFIRKPIQQCKNVILDRSMGSMICSGTFTMLLSCFTT